MDENNITLIDNLDIQKNDFTVKVRIIRLWSQPLFKDPEQLYSIEMILMDEEGSKIHSNVLQKWIPKFKNLLHEGAAIFIKNPTIARHVSKYKLIDNTKKLSLYYKTSVTKCLDFSGSLYGCNISFLCTGIKDQEHEVVDFSECPSLRSLTIKNCSGFGNSNMAIVGKLCPHLHKLDLRGLCGITDSGLLELLTNGTPRLVKINLSDCVNLTDKVVVDLVKIHGGSLEVLNLDRCRKIGDESLSANPDNCFLLKDLDVSKCEITNLGVSCLSRGRQTGLLRYLRPHWAQTNPRQFWAEAPDC
ncbi:hypothetical protein OSB04_015089 [Centaurea solstitialis]|uniref:Replication protein A 70 kDa DNA-binding subunit B/D first OB fold domain-containing protein n=1 Tax=Centaurea solstitialis TaxID=347529 RepID=A0AA38WIE0_9ASTR|nr:hypothetical protein OSB04_015089 [Centaurea solstitialis]